MDVEIQRKSIMKLTICNYCGNHLLTHETKCPHCTIATRKGIKLAGGAGAAMAMLLGFGVIGCGGDDKEDTSEDTSEEQIEPVTEPLYGETVETGDTNVIEPSNEADYGVPAIDNDGDGFYQDMDDCDDSDASAYPGSSPNDSTTDCMKDSDGDQYGDMSPANSNVVPGTDCDDTDGNVFPGQGC